MRKSFTPRERRIAVALAEALLPKGRIFAGAGPKTIDRLETILGRFGPETLPAYGSVLHSLEAAPLLSRRARFSRLPAADREAVLESWLRGGPSERTRLLFLSTALKTAHFDDPDVYHQLGCVYGRSARPEPKPRWWQQVQPGGDFAGQTIDCDVVVVGTGAGGAAFAATMARAGYAVVLLEEGDYHTREEFNGRSAEMLGKLYRNAGATYSVGNTIIPIPLGRGVGGSTLINSGTCFRTPDWILAQWQSELGLHDMTPEKLAPYFESVEREIGIETGRPEYLGGAARVVARGADRLGWSHHPLLRNAPDCDGQGVCAFGCPTDAKRSTNVSYVPRALAASATLITGARATTVVVANGRAEGIRAAVVGGNVEVRARAVALACGSLLTPALLLEQGLLQKSPALGANLTIHPAFGMSALFEGESIRGWEAIPQGYCVDEFHRDGILMEGASLPLDGGAVTFNLVGRRLIEVMESYDRVASFGAMVSERASRGRITVTRGRPLTFYWLKDYDVERLKRAIVLIGRLFFSAGATSILPPVRTQGEIHSLSELERLATDPISARDLMLTAYHPLGTCRMGVDVETSVVNTEHESHEVRGLYIVDGSAVPTSPAVNPQLTIMALAVRAAERLANRLS